MQAANAETATATDSVNINDSVTTCFGSLVSSLFEVAKRVHQLWSS